MCSRFTNCRFSVFFVFFLLIALTVPGLMAQLSTGKIEGYVRDKETSQPIAGAQVLIEGTRRGNVTNKDGYYFILNVPPGRQSISITYTGYQKITVADQLILAGQTTTVNGEISSTIIQLDALIIEGERDPLIPRDNTVTKQRLTSEQILATPATELEDLMVLQAGVQIGGKGSLARGLRIRGGRLGEETVLVDGVAVRNFTADPFQTGAWGDEGAFGGVAEEGFRAQDTSPLEFSVAAVEQVDIITGGFQAEYGNAQSGIINIVTKEGGPDYRGSIRFTTDQQNPRTADYGYNQATVDLSGPVKFIPGMHFSASTEMQGRADNNPTHASEGFRGINQKFVDRLNQAVVNDPVLSSPENAFTLDEFKTGRQFYAGKVEGESSSLFSPANPVRLPHNWSDRTMATSKVTYAPLSSVKVFASFQLSRNQRSYPKGIEGGDGNYFIDGHLTKEDLPDRNWGTETDVYIHEAKARRVRAANLISGVDWSFYQSADRSASLKLRYSRLRMREVSGSDLEVNWQRDSFLSWSPHEVRFEVENYPNRDLQSTKETIAKYYPDGTDVTVKDWDYETPFDYFKRDLYWLNYNQTSEFQNNYKFDLDFQINRYNRAQIGFQYNGFKNYKYQTNYNATKATSKIELDFVPYVMAAYIQNRTDLGDFVINYGLRYDNYVPRGNWGYNYMTVFPENTSPRNKHEYSPRFDVGFPVTDKSQLRFSYGRFAQLASMSHLFNYRNNFGGVGYSATDAFEAGLSYLLTDDLVLDVVTYYRDMGGNLGRRSVFRDYYRWHTEQRVRVWDSTLAHRVAGNTKGVDLTLSKRFSNNFALNINYTLQFSRSTGSSPWRTISNAFTYDPSTNERVTPPEDIRPVEGDRTHQFSSILNYVFPHDFREGTLVNKILRNVRINTVFTFQSGQPTGGAMYYRGRWNYNMDLRATKGFSLGRGMRFNLFTEVFNLLNAKNYTTYPSGYRYEPNSHAYGGVEWKWDDPNRSPRGDIWFNADFNGDGVLSLVETAKGRIAHRYMLATMDKRAWGLARQIRLGAELSF